MTHTSKTYTAYCNLGETIATGSLEHVAHAMITYDGQRYEIRQNGDWFELWGNTYLGGEAGQWIDYDGKSKNDVFENVIKLGGNNKTYAEEV